MAEQNGDARSPAQPAHQAIFQGFGKQSEPFTYRKTNCRGGQFRMIAENTGCPQAAVKSTHLAAIS
jgi:hypothetical protein